MIAKFGITGIQDPVEQGFSCGSDTAHMSILGYNPFEEFKGRGTFETIGAGINLLPDQLGFKCNFAYINTKTSIIEKRRVD
jgi:2,3-bisphosphoglycerate-independent phosphoglycerate mutase